ncbi:MAG: hypothetical protein AAF802_01925 [Planctomycetota bacterium]
MDGIVEPVLLVVGNPIAGNPSQFALEKAFESLAISWRVISCEVDPVQLETAIEGARALGMRAMLLDHSLKSAVDHSSDYYTADFLYRTGDQPEKWQLESVASRWLRSEIGNVFTAASGIADVQDAAVGVENASELGQTNVLWIGEPDERFPKDANFAEAKSPIAWASEAALDEADLIAVSGAGLSEPVETEHWPEATGNKLVIDFAQSPGRLHRLREIGYHVIDSDAIRIGTLEWIVQQITGDVPDHEVVREAIEEYFAV